MSLQLSRLKNWLTLEDSAKYLSLLTSEQVTTTDLLQIALQGDLTLSINFFNSHVAALGRKIPIQDAKLYRAPSLSDMTAGKPIEVIEGEEKKELIRALIADYKKTSVESESKPNSPRSDYILYFAGEVLHDYSGVIDFDRGSIHRITGLWDLPMVGAERLQIQEAFYSAIEGPVSDWVNISGVFLKHPKANRWANLLEPFDEKKQQLIPDNFFPTEFLPEREPLVIRRDELQRFADSLNEPDTAPTNKDSGSQHSLQQDLPHKFQQLYGAIAGGELPGLEAVIDAWYSHWNQRAARGERDTYPRNPDIQAWLESRGLSRNKAETIPPLIRPTWGNKTGQS